MRRFLYLALLSVLWTGCAVSHSSFSPARKYSPEQLQRDFHIYRTLLETHHAGLYWYTSKDSMDYFFDKAERALTDSMTEQQFRTLLTYTTAQINCGHTTVRSSKAYSKYSDTVRFGKLFPLSIKAWSDTMVVITNLNRRDSVLKRGVLINAINNRPLPQLLDSMFRYISADGRNLTHKYQTVSNRGFFGSLYTSIFGISDHYQISYTDIAGHNGTVTVPVFNPAADTSLRRMARLPQPPAPKLSAHDKKEARLNSVRLLKIDTVNQTAMMDLSSFARGYNLRQFFKNSFSALQENHITHLIVDVRGNGGGSVTNSTLISRYLANKSFKICDTLYAIHKKSPFEKYVKNHFWNNLFITLFTKKRKDGYYHFGYFERHVFKPKKQHHFSGKVYVLTGGNSFSATTLFVSSVREQDNVTLVGEETGGGAYGNTAWLIPDVTLPETGIVFRLPLFRLVMDKNRPKDGRGVQPKVAALPTVDAVRKGQDFKLDKVMELIKKDKVH